MILHKNEILGNKRVDSSTSKPVPSYAKIFKTVYKLAFSCLVILTVFLFAVSFWTPKEGSKTYITLRVLAFVGLFLCIGCIVANGIFSRNPNYSFYENTVTTKIRLNIWIPLIVCAVFVALPLYILLITSLKTSAEANSLIFSWWPKEGFTLYAYKNMFATTEAIGINIFRALLNTLFYSIVPVGIGCLVSALSAYGFSKLYFPGRDALFMFLLFTMMIPHSMSASTSYTIYAAIGWLDFEAFSLPMTIPGMFGGISTVFFLRNYYKGIPESLVEAAKLDGCGKMAIFSKVMIPLGFPALLVQFILGFIGAYNNFNTALIYLNYPEQFTLAIAVNFFDGQLGDRTFISAASVASLLPLLIIYAVLQKQILSGIQMSAGLKG